MKNPYLIGNKIYLRPLEKEDAVSLTTWMNDLDGDPARGLGQGSPEPIVTKNIL